MTTKYIFFHALIFEAKGIYYIFLAKCSEHKRKRYDNSHSNQSIKSIDKKKQICTIFCFLTFD